MNNLHATTTPRRDLLEFLLPVLVVVRWRVAFWQFLLRAITRRYRASALGLLWTLIVPLFTLGVYTFVFGVIMQSRWDAGGAGPGGTAGYSLQLFAGLTIFWLMADVLTESPGAIVQHANLVKKAVFPLEIIPITVVGSALFQTLINTAILLAATLLLSGHLPLTTLLYPLILLPFVLLLCGFAWFMSAFGVYVRDLTHVIGLLMTVLLFISPIFYSGDRVSPKLQPFLFLNPISFIVVQSRRVLLDGQLPDWRGLVIYLAVACVAISLGYLFFRKARRNFADVV